MVLTRQFRMPAYRNGSETGMLIETCAGLLDDESPEAAIIRETEEETGYRVAAVRKVAQAYMSPGSVTEMLHFYVTEYDSGMAVGKGGGLEEEQEDIAVLELPFKEALERMESGEIRDAKTIMLLQYAHIHGLFGQEPEQARPLHVLVAGPYRSGTGDDSALIERNVAFMNEIALQVYETGHLPVLGEWYALPLLATAGSDRIGDDIFDRMFHPSSIRLLDHVDAVLRVGGASSGADEMVRIGKEKGKRIFERVEDLPILG